MSSDVREGARRTCFADPHATPDQAAQEQRLLALLLAQDGSTTRLCETIAGGPIGVQVLRQLRTVDVPNVVTAQLPGTRFIERVTSLVAHGEVMMDNLSYIALHGLEPDIEEALAAGRTPIGHLLARWWVRREAVPDSGELSARLWQFSGSPDPAASRSYRIDTPQGPRMLITETYRRGMLMNRAPRQPEQQRPAAAL